jgi:hypothetical protein
MPWRLIGIIAVLAVLLLFIGGNLDNKCNLSLIFFQFNDVPVYLTVFISFILGLLFSLPFFFFNKKGGKEKPSDPPLKPAGKMPDAANIPTDSSYGID